MTRSARQMFSIDSLSFIPSLGSNEIGRGRANCPWKMYGFRRKTAHVCLAGMWRRVADPR